MFKNMLILAVFCMSFSVFADNASVNTPAPTQTGPCEQIVQACKNAKFEKNEAGIGKGLWVDCVNPIMTKSAQPKKAVLPLPSIDPSLISACLSKHPNFGQGKKGPQAK